MTKRSSIGLVVVAILQLIVGAIVVLGGAALIYFSIDTTGKALGVVHAILGLTVFPAAYLLWTRKSGAWSLTIGVDALIIAFSSVSEGILYAVGSLPTSAFADSIAGTLVAIMFAIVVIVQLTVHDLRITLRNDQKGTGASASARRSE